MEEMDKACDSTTRQGLFYKNMVAFLDDLLDKVPDESNNWQSLSLSLLPSFQKGPLCTIVKLINTNLFCISAKPIVETR